MPTGSFFSFRLYDHRFAARSANAGKMTATKGPRTYRRVAGTEPGTPASPASCTRHYWAIIYSLYPDSHTPLIRFPGGVKSRSRTREREHQGEVTLVTGGEMTRTTTCTDTEDAILLLSRDRADSLDKDATQHPPRPTVLVIRPVSRRTMAAPLIQGAM